MSNVNGVNAVYYEKTDTYKIADSQSLTFMDPVYLSSGKIAKSTDTLATNIIGFAAQTKSMGVLSTAGQQEYAAIHVKGRMKFTGLKDSGSYTNDIAIGDYVSIYYDGTNYFVVKNTTNPVGQVVEGTMDTAGSSTIIIVDVDLSSENVKPSELQFPFLVPTDSKIEFRDTGIFIQSSADGQLTISSDGSTTADIKLTGNVTIDNDLVVTGSFSGTSEGQTWTGDIHLNDNKVFNFEGIANDMDGMTIDCDASGDSTIAVTAGQLDFITKDGVVKFHDSDVATDYLQIITGSGSSLMVFAAEPSGLFRFKDAGDANNSDVLDLTLTDGGSANKMTSAVAFEIETTAGGIILDSAVDITLDPAGNDIIFGVSAGKITLGATSTTLYGGDTGGDDLIFLANSSDADPQLNLLGGGGILATILDQDFSINYDGSNYVKVEVAADGETTITSVGSDADFNIVSGTTGDININATLDINLNATGADINMNTQLNITSTSADQFFVIYDGSNTFGIDVDSDGSTTLTTVGTNADFEIATGTTGDITLDASAALIFEPATTATFTLAAAGQVIVDADTTDSTVADVLLINVGVNSASVNAIGIDLDVGTALSAAELAKGVYVDANAKAADADTSGVLAFDALMTALSTSRSDLTGFRVLFDGTMDTADAVKGVVVDGSSFTMDDTAGIVHGVNIEFASLTDTDYTTREFNALDITMPATYQGTDIASAAKITGAGGQVDVLTGAGTIAGMIMLMDTADNNSFQGLVISKDQATVAAVGTSTVSNSALDVSQACSSATSADAAMTVSNNMVSFVSTNTTSLALADVYSNTVLALAYTASTTGAGTATSTGTALSIDYNLTETAGTLTVDDTNIIDIDVDFDGTVAVANSGDINIMNINVNDDETIVWGTSNTCTGINLDMSGMVVSDATLTLTGVKVAMPATYGASTEYGVYVSGDGTTVALCSDGAVGISISGTLTAGLEIPAGATATDGIVIADACGANGISITGACTTSGVSVSGDCGTGVVIGAQTTAGLTIGNTVSGITIGTSTTGLAMGNCTTGITLGTATTGINVPVAVTNLFDLAAASTAPCGANTAGASTLTYTNWIPIAIDIGGTTHYFAASQTLAAT